MLDSGVAQQIASKTSKICGYSVSIINSTGLIIGSGDISRVNTIHGGIEPVFKYNQFIEHDEEQVKSFAGAFAGVACPINFDNQVIGAVGIRGNPNELRKFVHLIKNQVEMMYQREMYFQMTKIKSDAFDLFIQELLSQNSEKNVKHLISLGEINNINLQIPRYALMIDIEYDNSKINQLNELTDDGCIKRMNKLINSVNNFFEDPQNILTKIDGNHFLVLKVEQQAKDKNIQEIEDLHQFLLKKHGISTIIGIGNHYENLGDFVKSYHEAKQAVLIAKRMGDKCGVFHIDELYVGRILNEVSNSTLMDILNNSNATKLLDPTNSIFKETLFAFCENDLNLSKTARDLYVHRNTLLYRLNRIHQITGLNPNNFMNAMTLMLLLRLKTFD